MNQLTQAIFSFFDYLNNLSLRHNIRSFSSPIYSPTQRSSKWPLGFFDRCDTHLLTYKMIV